jgi:two-component system, response regulator PdtaR
VFSRMAGDLKRQASGQEILIVEDEFLIALQIEEIVERLGFSVLGPAGSVTKGLDLLRRNAPSAAILDVNLDGVLVTPIAQMCRDRHIPFVLVTAYGRLALDEPLLENAPRIRKPFDEDSIKKFLSDAIGTELG